MRILLFSDLHSDRDAAARLVERAKHADVVIGAGDFGRQRRDVDACIGILRRIECPALLVPGNNESVEELRTACRDWPRAEVLHGEAAEVHGVLFFGLGGGVPETPFGDWSYDLSEAEAEALLRRCPPGAVLISHSPPRGVLDEPGGGGHMGSTAVRGAIRQHRPLLVVCGHVHACWGRTEWLDGVPVVNAGPAGVDWELTPTAQAGDVAR